ncbi:MAG: poly-gamma-glutamate synthase PgsB [Ilumatobacteraceae bacterium]
MPVAIICGYLVSLALLARWGLESVAHRRRIDRLYVRVHVNGIRGKSTVTRIIAGMLREADIVTIGKATGTEAVVINREGVDEIIHRKAAPTILEQIEVAKKYVDSTVNALVIECMALRPQYQAVSEKMIVRSNIGVLTNVREDHQDVMGETLPEIARSLLNTCPYGGILVTAERNPEITPIIEEVAALRKTAVVYADPETVTDTDLGRFDYIAFKENVAIALAIAEMLEIPRNVAMDGMVAAAPDPGVLRMKELRILGKRVTWANLFAVNDRESMVVAMEKLVPFITPETTTVGILNNRTDRERRAVQFADVAVKDLSFDRLVTFGAFEGLVTDLLVANGYPLDCILNLGDAHSPPVEHIVDRMVGGMPTEHVLVVGFVNIHTHQAEMMLEYFEHEAEPWLADPV